MKLHRQRHEAKNTS